MKLIASYLWHLAINILVPLYFLVPLDATPNDQNYSYLHIVINLDEKIGRIYETNDATK